MKKIYTALMFVVLAAFIFSVAGCGGSSNSNRMSFSNNNQNSDNNNDNDNGNNNDNEQTTETVKQVAVLTSPVFQRDKEYRILKGATLSGMKSAQYYIANTGTEANQATINLGFLDTLNTTLVFIDDDTGTVVFAYDPSGTANTAITDGTVTASGGTQLSYNALEVSSAAFFTALDVDTSSAKKIVLNGTTATIDGVVITSYDYVWHADPDHSDEYYTLGIDGTTEYTKKQMKAAITEDIYIAHDVIYMPSGLEYTGTVKNDEDTEYAAYYSSSVQEEAAEEFTALSGDAFAGPYIFATLPSTMGMGGGTAPGSGDFTPPDGSGPGSGDFTPPDGSGPGSGDFTPPDGSTPPDGNPPSMSASSVSAASYNDQISSTIDAMTHSAEDAYANPVLHITEPGVYSLEGTWNGQIWIDVGENEGDNVAVILNGVTVKCTVAPAIVFKEAYECGHGSDYDPDADDDVTADAVAALMKDDSADVGRYVMDSAGAMVVIADDTTNSFTGANVYRMLKLQAKKSSVTAMDGTDVDQQKKRYKMDGAFYSFVSLAIGGGEKANGVLNITSSTYEGLNSEMHLTVESGTLTISAPDDAINVNEDDISVFTMLDGTMTITSQNGDGIDSNGYVAIIGGSLDITAGTAEVNAQGEGGIDAERGVYISDSVHYTHHAVSGGGTPGSGENPNPGGSDNTGSDESGSSENIPVTTISETPVSTDTSYTVSTADTSMRIKTTNGTTTFNMGTGSTATFIVNSDSSDTASREISTSGNVFPLVKKVNTFWKIR